MNTEKEIILINNAKEYFSSGKRDLGDKSYNSAVVMFFKCLIALVDLYLLKELGDTPSSHSDRFRTIQEKFPDIYNLVDKDFPFYQESYIQKMSKELAEVIRDDAKIMAEKNEIKL